MLNPHPGVIWLARMVVVAAFSLVIGMVIGFDAGARNSQARATGAPTGNAGDGVRAVTTPVAPPAPCDLDHVGDVELTHDGERFAISGWLPNGRMFAELDMLRAGYDYVKVFDGVDTHTIWPQPPKRSVGVSYIGGTYSTLCGHPETYGIDGGFMKSATRPTQFRDLEIGDGDPQTIQGFIPKADGGPLR